MSNYLSQKQLDFFEQYGYLIVPNVVDEATLSALWQEYDERLDEVATHLANAEILTNTYPHLPFDQRYCKLITKFFKIPFNSGS